MWEGGWSRSLWTLRLKPLQLLKMCKEVDKLQLAIIMSACGTEYGFTQGLRQPRRRQRCHIFYLLKDRHSQGNTKLKSLVSSWVAQTRNAFFFFQPPLQVWCWHDELCQTKETPEALAGKRAMWGRNFRAYCIPVQVNSSGLLGPWQRLRQCAPSCVGWNVRLVELLRPLCLGHRPSLPFLEQELLFNFLSSLLSFICYDSYRALIPFYHLGTNISTSNHAV